MQDHGGMCVRNEIISALGTKDYRLAAKSEQETLDEGISVHGLKSFATSAFRPTLAGRAQCVNTVDLELVEIDNGKVTDHTLHLDVHLDSNCRDAR